MLLLFRNRPAAGRRNGPPFFFWSRVNGPNFFPALAVLFFFVFLPATAISAELTVAPSLAVSGRYTDNIFLAEKNKEEDLYTRFTPALQLRQRNERGELSLDGQFDIYAYFDKSSLNSVDQRYSISGSYGLTPVLSVNAGGRYEKDFQPDREVSTSGLVFSSSKREKHSESFGMNWMVSEKTTIGATVSSGRNKYEDDEYSNYSSQSYSLEISTNLSRYFVETSGLLFLSHSRYDYDLSDVEYTMAALGLGKSLNEKYSVFGWVGPAYSKTEFEYYPWMDTEEWSGTANVSINGEFEKSSLNCSLSYRLEPDSYSSGGVNRTTLSGGYTKRLKADLRMGLSASYFRNESTAKNFLSRDRDETNLQISPRFFCNLTDDLALEANYRLVRLNDKATDQVKTQNSFFLRLTWRHRYRDTELAEIFK